MDRGINSATAFINLFLVSQQTGAGLRTNIQEELFHITTKYNQINTYFPLLVAGKDEIIQDALINRNIFSIKYILIH